MGKNYTAVQLKMQNMREKDRKDIREHSYIGKDRVKELAADMGWNKSYLNTVIFAGDYRPPLEKRIKFADLLNLSRRAVEEHFANARNAK